MRYFQSFLSAIMKGLYSMEYIDDALLYQIDPEIDFEEKIKLYKARVAISGNNALWEKGRGFRIIKENASNRASWIINALHGQDVYLGGEVRKVSSLSQITASYREESLQTKDIEEYSVIGERKVSNINQKIDDYIQSVFGVFKDSNTGKNRKSYPSAGGLYTVQVFVVKRLYNSEHGDWSVEHYMPSLGLYEHINYIEMDDLATVVGTSETIDINKLDFFLAYGVIPILATAKYGNRGYKFALLEVGHMMQCAITNARNHSLLQRIYGYYDEHSISDLLGMNSQSVWIEGIHCFKFGGEL